MRTVVVIVTRTTELICFAPFKCICFCSFYIVEHDLNFILAAEGRLVSSKIATGQGISCSEMYDVTDVDKCFSRIKSFSYLQVDISRVQIACSLDWGRLTTSTYKIVLM